MATTVVRLLGGGHRACLRSPHTQALVISRGSGARAPATTTRCCSGSRAARVPLAWGGAGTGAFAFAVSGLAGAGAVVCAWLAKTQDRDARVHCEAIEQDDDDGLTPEELQAIALFSDVSESVGEVALQGRCRFGWDQGCVCVCVCARACVM